MHFSFDVGQVFVNVSHVHSIQQYMHYGDASVKPRFADCARGREFGNSTRHASLMSSRQRNPSLEVTISLHSFKMPCRISGGSSLAPSPDFPPFFLTPPQNSRGGSSPSAFALAIAIECMSNLEW